ncbi:MAG: SulP family inorganic anion transporter [Prochlorococcus sp.]|nr:SulP family inorganic anion transporter [Prochlorococcaceae cyanobacterium Fu_MAG_50]
MALIHGLHLRNLRGDLLGGITAAVVALPLALAFGNAALGEGGAIYGLYGAVVVGFLAALFGGTPSQVSGPTGPMSVTVAGIVASLAAVGVSNDLSAGEILPLVMGAVVIGGLFQILFGVLRLGRYITLVPYSVISGFMSGIGVIILVLQIGPLLGISTRGGVIDSLRSLFSNFDPNWAAVGVGVMTLAVVFLAPRRITQWVPSPLLALLIVTPLSMVFFPGEIVPRIGSIPEGGLTFVMPNWNAHLGVLIQAGLVLAVLGAIDSLLTSLVADNISQTRHNSDRELIGQGIGNTVAGLFAGLPGAGATMRTVINVKSGGSTPISGMVHSIVLLIVLIGAGPLAAQIPTALLAGILIKVGLDIIDWGFLLRAHRLSMKTALVMYSVLLMTVFWDLIWAVLVGVFVANLLTIESLTQAQLEGMDADNRLIGAGTKADPSEAEVSELAMNGELPLPAAEQDLLDRCGGEVMLFRLRGPLSFGAAKGITERMALVRNYKVLILDITDVPRLGVTATLAIEQMVQEAGSHSRTAYVAGASGRVRERLERFGVKGVMDSRLDALKAALEGPLQSS